MALNELFSFLLMITAICNGIIYPTNTLEFFFIFFFLRSPTPQLHGRHIFWLIYRFCWRPSNFMQFTVESSLELCLIIWYKRRVKTSLRIVIDVPKICTSDTHKPQNKIQRWLLQPTTFIQHNPFRL